MVYDKLAVRKSLTNKYLLEWGENADDYVNKTAKTNTWMIYYDKESSYSCYSCICINYNYRLTMDKFYGSVTIGVN